MSRLWPTRIVFGYKQGGHIKGIVICYELGGQLTHRRIKEKHVWDLATE